MIVEDSRVLDINPVNKRCTDIYKEFLEHSKASLLNLIMKLTHLGLRKIIMSSLSLPHSQRWWLLVSKTKIQVLKTDNAKEYFRNSLGAYLMSQGIAHVSSCVDPPRQKGVAERKNRHLLEVA